MRTVRTRSYLTAVLIQFARKVSLRVLLSHAVTWVRPIPSGNVIGLGDIIVLHKHETNWSLNLFFQSAWCKEMITIIHSPFCRRYPDPGSLRFACD